MSILNHHLWSKLQSHIYKQLSHISPRTQERIYRLEFHNDTSETLLDEARDISVECANPLCRQLYNPVRRRMGRSKRTGVRQYTNRHYLALSCGKPSCVRTDAVTVAKQAVEAVVCDG